LTDDLVDLVELFVDLGKLLGPDHAFSAHRNASSQNPHRRGPPRPSREAARALQRHRSGEFFGQQASTLFLLVLVSPKLIATEKRDNSRCPSQRPSAVPPIRACRKVFVA